MRGSSTPRNGRPLGASPIGAHPPETPPPLGQRVRLIAGFGGFLGRKSDGHPGPKALWEGMQKVRAFAIGIAAKAPFIPSG